MLAQTIPSVISYDPAFAYELAVIVQEGLRRMYVNNEHKIFYITLYNENLMMPEMPENVQEGIVKGVYKYKKSDKKPAKTGVKAHLLGAGVIMDQVLKAVEILEAEGVSTDVWSVTSWNELYRDAVACDRWNMLHPGETEKTPYIQEALKGEEGVFVSANDWMKVTAGQLAPWMPANFVALGTDGFGLSESRENLRDYFEISAKYIAFATVRQLHRSGKLTDKAVLEFMKKYGIDSDKKDPMSV
jgi:pyruvate dehydrogenase E1 component